MSSVLCEEKKSVKKLQIGIKKRVENCTIKSRKGDLLSMHYTVISFIFVATFSPCISWKVRTKSGPLVGLILLFILVDNGKKLSGYIFNNNASLKFVFLSNGLSRPGPRAKKTFVPIF